MRVTATWALGLAILLVATAALYWPGLKGPFLFDDYANLPALGHQGTIDTATEATNFIFGGTSGPSGRPLALASFLLDAETWPTAPYPFKRTNLIVHLLCGLALFALCRQLLATPRLQPLVARGHWSPPWLALLATGLWLLHPINVSTTLYVVQRMAQLAALFSILGLAAYVHGRRQLPDTPLRAQVWMALGIGLGTTLGVLSKENAVIVPVLALVIERLCFDRPPLLPRQRALIHTLTTLPSLALLVYFAYLLTLGRISEHYAHRDFSLAERLLTQPRAILEYLYLTAWPGAGSRGLYGDSFAISTSLFSPASTLPSIFGLASLTLLSLILPPRWQALRLAVLFFLAGHVLEGSIIPLELYFEHRNYLPTMLLPLPLCLALAEVKRPALRTAAALALLAGMAAALAPRVGIWSDQLRLVAHAVRLAPDSVRANLDLANLLESRGAAAAAAEVFAGLVRMHPDKAELMLLNVLHHCRQNTLKPSNVDSATAVLSSKPFDPRIVGVIEPLAEAAIKAQCAALTPERALRLLDALATNPHFTSDIRRAQVAVAQAHVWLHTGDTARAVQSFEQALVERKGPEIVLVAMRELALKDRFCEARGMLLRHRSLLDDHQHPSNVDYSAERQHFEAVLGQELASRGIECPPVAAIEQQ